MECSKEFQKKASLCFIDYDKACDCVDHEKLWVALKEKDVPQHLFILVHDLCRRQEATVRTEYGKT